MKKIIAILAMQAALFATPLAHAQDEGTAEGEASGEASAEASGSISAEGGSTAADSTYATATYGELGHSAFGIGAKLTLLGIPAAEIAYHVSNKVLITGLIGFVTFTPDVDGAESQTAFAIGVGGFFNLFHNGIGDFMIGGRFLYASADDEDMGMVFTGTQTDIEFPARAQLQLNHHLAVHFEVGLAISIAGDDGGVTTPGGATRFVLGGGDIFGTGGFTVYF